MFRVTNLDNVAQKRTIRPLYAATQATPYAGYLDDSWDRSHDILPGMVVTKLAGENFSLCSTISHKPFGLSALFVAPALGIDELASSGNNNFTVWTGGPDATFEVLAPAFDTSADYSQAGDGSRKLLSFTLAAHAQGPGKLTVSGGTNAASLVIAELIDVVGTSKLIVRLLVTGN